MVGRQPQLVPKGDIAKQVKRSGKTASPNIPVLGTEGEIWAANLAASFSEATSKDILPRAATCQSGTSGDWAAVVAMLRRPANRHRH